MWIQTLPGNINMTYPFNEDPLVLLRRQGVRLPADSYPIEWAAGEYATFGFGNIPARDHAFLIDQLFVKVLGCDDETYKVKVAIEALE